MKRALASKLKIASFLGLITILLIFSACNSPKTAAVNLKIAVVQYSDSPLSELSLKGIKDGLSLVGLTADKDYKMKVYNAQGDIGTLNMIFDAVLNERPRLIFVTSTPTLQVAVNKIKDIPIVFSCIADPLIAGAGKSFEDHLPNVTGISTLSDVGGMVALIKLISPGMKKIGTIYSPGEINSVRNMEDLKKHAELEGIELVTMPVNTSVEIIDATMSLIASQPSIVCQIVDNLTSVSIPSIIKICRDHNIPVFGFVSDQAEKGAVVVISRDYVQAGIDAARLAGQILDGKSPGEIPFEFVSKTNILINPAEAARYNIIIPQEILSRENVIIVK